MVWASAAGGFAGKLIQLSAVEVHLMNFEDDPFLKHFFSFLFLDTSDLM